MTSHVPDPLTPEERELAARLARIGPHGEPSPTLDARILGAAQAAAARKPDRSRQRRWPAWAGIAATLALALGAVWQLRPVQEVSVQLEEAPPVEFMSRKPEPAATKAEVAASKPAPARQVISPARSMPVPPPPPRSPRPKLADPALPQRQPRETPAAKAVEPAPRVREAPKPMAPPVIFDDPSPLDVLAPAPPPPPAPPAPVSAKPAAPVAAAARSRDLQPPAARVSALTESGASDAQLADTATATSATVTVTDLPVASDRQLPPVDWIERIRQRRDAGDIASARASLALLQLDYPQLLLPEDVRAIAPPPPDR